MKQPATIKPLATPWSSQAMCDIPLNDYPRPQLAREQWLCLNGMWRYAITDTPDAPNAWDGLIRVPFSPECMLSGVERKVDVNQTLWYERTLQAVPVPGRRTLLHFGAVDQTCAVWVNGQAAGQHAGGYHPFTMEVTDLIHAGENVLRVRVHDLCDQGPEPYGKQKIDRGGIWYTGHSGIWQTVWAETVPENYITTLNITPRYDDAQVEIAPQFARDSISYTVRVLANGETVAQAESDGGAVRIDLPGFRPWSPEDPFLYDVEIIAGEDRVRSYFGMRSFGYARGAHGRRVLALNGKPIFHHGLLDQGYWSDGMFTPPSDEAMVTEITRLKALGFNMLRKHIKIEPLRWYYHCDRLGMLVWQDFVSGGGPYNPLIIQVLPWLGLMLNDHWYKVFGRGCAEGRACYRRDMERTVSLLRNCVSLCCWVPFNEGWGQFDSLEIAREVRQMDDARYIDHASGWHDRGGGDFQSAHIYYKSYHPKRDKHDRVMALTEYGGFSLAVQGHMSSDQLFGYKGFTTQQELENAWVSLYEKEVIPAIAKGLSADVYTQVSDVEDEINGVFTYDRHVIKLTEAAGCSIAEKIRKEFARAFGQA